MKTNEIKSNIIYTYRISKGSTEIPATVVVIHHLQRSTFEAVLCSGQNAGVKIEVQAGHLTYKPQSGWITPVVLSPSSRPKKAATLKDIDRVTRELRVV